MADWKQELDVYLVNIERHTTNSLLRIRDVFDESGRGLDQTFRKHFINVTRNRIIEACDRFEMELSQPSHDRDRSPLPNHGRKNERSAERDRSPSLNRHRMRSPSSGRASTHSSASNEMRELDMQNEYLNDIAISGVPLTARDDLFAMFLRLCKKFDLNITESDIRDIYRGTPRTMVVVRFKSRHVKEDILKFVSRRTFRTDDMMPLKPNEHSSRIYIGYRTTEYYKKMYMFVRSAMKKNLIHSYSITKRGFSIRRTQNSTEQHFVSCNKLVDYLNDLREPSKRPKPARSSSDSDW